MSVKLSRKLPKHVKTIDAINAFQAVVRLINEEAPKTVQFSYALVKNKRTLEVVVQQYNSAIAEDHDPVLDELLKVWREIAPPYAQVDANGEPLLDPMGNVLIAPDRVIEYNAACENIVTTSLDYRKAFDRRNALVQTLQNAETDAQIYPIALSLFPPEIDFATVESLYGLIDGDH